MAAQAFGEKNLSRDARGTGVGVEGGEEKRGYMRLLLERDGERERRVYCLQYHIKSCDRCKWLGGSDHAALSGRAQPSHVFPAEGFFYTQGGLQGDARRFQPIVV